MTVQLELRSVDSIKEASAGSKNLILGVCMNVFLLFLLVAGIGVLK